MKNCPQITKEAVHCKLIIRELEDSSCRTCTHTVSLPLVIIQKLLERNNLG